MVQFRTRSTTAMAYCPQSYSNQHIPQARTAERARTAQSVDATSGDIRPYTKLCEHTALTSLHTALPMVAGHRSPSPQTALPPEGADALPTTCRREHRHTEVPRREISRGRPITLSRPQCDIRFSCRQESIYQSHYQVRYSIYVARPPPGTTRPEMSNATLGEHLRLQWNRLQWKEWASFTTISQRKRAGRRAVKCGRPALR